MAQPLYAIREGDMTFVILAPFVVLIGQAAVFFWCKDTIIEQNITTMEADDQWSSFVVERATIRNLITNFRSGFREAKQFESIHRDFNNIWADADGYWGVVLWRVASVAEVIAALFLGFGGKLVLDGKMPVGSFVTALGAISSFGGVTASIFQAIFDLMKGYASIQKISDIFNAETRRVVLKTRRDRRQELIKTYNEGLQNNHHENAQYDDRKECIMLHEVVFAHGAKHKDDAEDHHCVDIDIDGKGSHKAKVGEIGEIGETGEIGVVNFQVPTLSAVIEGGNLIALTGPGGSGKTTLLRLLARQYMPSSGWISYPNYWRVRILDAADPPHFFGGTMKDNLNYGSHYKHTDREISTLLKRLGVSHHLINNMADYFVNVNGSNLSLTDATLCSIARCLLSSVDLLLISNLMDTLDETVALEPKTVIISTKNRQLEKHCDFLISMADTSWLRTSNDDVQSEMAAERETVGSLDKSTPRSSKRGDIADHHR